MTRSAAATSIESLLHSAAAMACVRLSSDRQTPKAYPTFGSWSINPEVGQT
jgi:hypothetical protein